MLDSEEFVQPVVQPWPFEPVNSFVGHYTSSDFSTPEKGRRNIQHMRDTINKQRKSYTIREQKSDIKIGLSQDHNNPTARQFDAAYKRLLVHTEIVGPDSGNITHAESLSILTHGSGTHLTRGIQRHMFKMF
nr:unnamed protein product [Callosobruchus analis]